MSIIQTLTPFDSTKQPIEGTTEFRANATYAWSWLIEHTNQQIALINQINSTVTDMNTLAQTVTTKATEVANNTATVAQAKIDAIAARDATLNAKSAVESMTGLGLTGLVNGDTLEYDSSVSKFKNTNLHSKTVKTTPVDADEMMIADSTSSWSLKKITWTGIKTTIKTYLDGFFIPKILTPTTNALAKIQADGTIKNSSIIESSSGNVGIGDLNPQYKLSINSASALGQNAGDFITNISKSTNVGNVSFLTQTTYRHTAGNSHSGTEERIQKIVDTTAMGYVAFGDNAVSFGTNLGKSVSINTTNCIFDFGLNTAQSIWSNSARTASTDWRHFYGTSNNNTIANIVIYGNGNILNANNVYGSLSDVKLKENIVDTSPKLDKLMQVRVVNYNFIGQEQKQIGVIAQEIEEIFPGLVDETKDTIQVEVEKEKLIPALEEIRDNEGNVVQDARFEYIEKYTELETIETGETTKSVKYSVLYMMMLKGMQEQQEIINDLKSRISILENKDK